MLMKETPKKIIKKIMFENIHQIDSFSIIGGGNCYIEIL